MRSWRTWLLILTAFGQGTQWALNPQAALAAPSLSRLQPLGPDGWRLAGLLIVAIAALLVHAASRPVGHALGFTVYLLLVIGMLAKPYWPALTGLAAGLHGGEFFFWARRARG